MSGVSRRAGAHVVGGGGYRQEACAGIGLDYYAMRERAERYIGITAVVMDFDKGMLQAPDAGWQRLTRCMERLDEPELVDSIPALKEAILLALDAPSSEAKWEGVWTPIASLYRMLDDTITVRSVAKRMKWNDKPSRPRLTTANRNSDRGTCAHCGRDIDLGASVWIERGKVWHAECDELELTG